MTSEMAIELESELDPRERKEFCEPGFSPESWRSAREVADTVLPVVTPFHTAVRILTSHVIEDEEKLRCLTWTLKFPSFRIAVCRFCESIIPESTFEPDSATAVRLKELLGFDVCAVILGLLLSYRRMKRIVPGGITKNLAKAPHNRAEIGFHLGREISELGSAAGMLLGGMRGLAFGLICAAKPQEYGKYRRHVDQMQIPFDVGYEIDEWGFSHPQVMALLTQRLGFGHLPAVAFFMGLSPLFISPTKDLWASRFRTVALWIEELYSGASLSHRISLRGFTITEQDLQKLTESVMTNLKSKSNVLWLDGGLDADQKR